MTKNLLRAGALSCALLATTALTAPSFAQTAPPPRFSQVDDNGVDLVTGDYPFAFTEGSIGAGEGALSLTSFAATANARNQWTGLLYRRTGATSLIYVEFGHIAETFTISGSTHTSTLANGGTLVALGGGQFRYTASDGTRILFDTDHEEPFQFNPYPMSAPSCQLADAGTCAIPLSVTRPNGMTFTINWDIVPHCDGYDSELNCINPQAFFRFDGVTSSANYSFSVGYVTDFPGSGSAPVPDWYKRTGATFTNLASAPSPLPSSSWANPSTGVIEATDTGGRTWRFTTSGGNFSIRRPGSTAEDVTITFSGGVVTQVVRDGVTTTYSRSTSGNTRTTTITQVDGDPNTADPQTVVVADLALGRITAITNAVGETTDYTYDSNGRLTRVTMPENNYTEYTYDARGNVTGTRMRNKAGTSGNDIVTSASYPATCANPVTCNSPTSTTDARGYATDYTWDSTHGGLLTVTPPAPSAGASRPQTRIAYAQVTAVSGQPVWLPTNVSACQATASCDGQADEAETNVAYGTSNLLPSSVERRNGSGTLSATTAMTYDSVGNLLTLDGPLSGTADTTRYRYDAARQVVGVVGPDPDGGGALEHRAIRTTYRSDGLPTKVERGTVDSQSDAHWAAFTSLEEVQTEYDSHDRPVVQRLVGGGTTYALTQTGYDPLGRVRCVAQRMNPAEFATASLPSNVCAPDTEGSFGPDRIVRASYDAAGRVTLVETGVGTPAEADEVATAYTDNGQVAHVTDAEGNRTTYLYDGHDRLRTTRYPHPTTDGQSSSGDAEELSRDDNGNVTQLQLRDGQTIAFAYDRLNRLVTKNLPGSEPDVTYSYDLLGRLTGASYTGHALSFTYDALGRNLTQVGPLGTVAYQYDAAGRRTRLTYPGSGLYVDYDLLVTGEVTKIRENGASSGAGVLATYAYDDLGRRTSLTRGNTTTTSYSYDAVSRLSQLVQNPVGTTHDLTLGFGYNPASQIVGNTRSNDAYAFTAIANQNVASTHNGLNQVTATGGTSVSHDGRGNVSAIGMSSYGYNSENMLVSAPGSVMLSYDPLLRLYQTSGSVTTRMAYDGQSLIAEYNGSSNLLRRYVHGPGVDEPIVWYEGTGTSDRRWLHADERGSIVAISNGTGAVTDVNAYDEYGIPQTANIGRFQYTGQQWIAELGLYHYRARMYSPTLGRFMQTDPIGYMGGMNLYAYVGNDPLNYRDPTGLEEDEGDGDDSPPIPVTACRLGTIRVGGFCIRLLDLYGIYTTAGVAMIGRGDGNEQTITVTATRRRLRPSTCVTSFAGATLSNQRRGFDLRTIEFREGLDRDANIFSRRALNTEGTSATTQGYIIYVNPGSWDSATNPNGTTFWEEIFHTVQFTELGGIGFYSAYGATSSNLWLRGRDYYNENPLEREAKEWAQTMAQRYRRERPCP